MIDVWTEAHDTSKSKGSLDEDEKDEIRAWMQSRPLSPLTLAEARRQRANGSGH